MRSLLALTMLVLCAACQRKTSSPTQQHAAEGSAPKHVIGNQLMSLEFRVGSIWGSGYTVRVFPDEYLVLEDGKCRQAKKTMDGKADPLNRGLCVMRIDNKQSEQFIGAADRYRRYAIPLSNFSVEDPVRRPDGKRCQNVTTDMDQLSLIWVRTGGAEIAAFDSGCDRAEFAEFYDGMHHVTNALPISQITAKD